jgi:hypothetical protein
MKRRREIMNKLTNCYFISFAEQRGVKVVMSGILLLEQEVHVQVR